MREILFRGKRVIDGKWVESCCPLGEMHCGTVTYDFIQDTVCQYTGLADKNGTKIFEGDIIKINNDVKKAFEISDGAVAYCGGSFIIGGNNGSGTLNSLFVITDINYALRGEVIGNIFDDSELIGDQP